MAGFTATALGIASLVGIGTSVAGGIMSANAEAQRGRQMQQAEAYNAAVSRQQAEALQIQGNYEQEKAKDEQRRLVGRQRALVAATGVKFSGSPLDIMSDSIANSEMDMAVNRWNTQTAMNRANSQASYSDMLGSSYAKAGKIGQQEGWVKAGTTLLTGGADWANKYAGAFKYKGGA